MPISRLYSMMLWSLKKPASLRICWNILTFNIFTVILDWVRCRIFDCGYWSDLDPSKLRLCRVFLLLPRFFGCEWLLWCHSVHRCPLKFRRYFRGWWSRELSRCLYFSFCRDHRVWQGRNADYLGYGERSLPVGPSNLRIPTDWYFWLWFCCPRYSTWNCHFCLLKFDQTGSIGCLAWGCQLNSRGLCFWEGHSYLLCCNCGCSRKL